MAITDGKVGEIIADRAFPPITSAYQPIVDLRDLRTVGFEALARWPEAPHLNPGVVFATARRAGTLDDIDVAAQQAAVGGAQDAGLPESYSLFVNVEADTSPAVDLAQSLSGAIDQPGRRLVIEITERALLVDPGRVIEIADSARALGIGVALDDVGSNTDCLRMLDFVAPDIIKIDGPLIRSRRLASSEAATLAAIAAYTETNPATIVIAEGIETEDDIDRARSLGAAYGQGWHLGRPGNLTTGLPVVDRPLPRYPARGATDPYDPPSSIFEHVPAKIGHKSLLSALSRHLEHTAAVAGEPVTVLATFQNAESFTPAVAQRFSALAIAHPHAFVAALAVDMPARPAPHVHGIAIEPDELLSREWTITVVAPHYFGALIAHDLGDPDGEPDRRYAYIFTHDRPLVTSAARSLMRRIHRSDAPGRPTR